jgi:hypothetical protein
MVDISGSGYPKILLRGSSLNPGVLNASGKNKRVLLIANGNNVELGNHLTLRGGSASNFGGGVYISGSTFTMISGGTISDNTAYGNGGGGGGVYVSGGSTFIMNEGTISDNKASGGYGKGGGVSVDGGSTFTMNGGTISDSEAMFGGGVCVDGGSTFTMSGGYIQGNTAFSNGGGGVYFWGSGTFTKTSGTIYGDDNTIHDNGSTENTATSGNGHAVYLYDGKKRNATSPADPDLYAKYESNAWTYTYTDPDGLGDIGDNW